MMGMYTELYMSFEIRKNVPDEVKNVIMHLFNDEEEPNTLPDHEFFKCDRWRCIGSCSSHYFTPFALSKVWTAPYGGEGVYVTTRSDLKNYGDEINLFLDWVMPYIDAIDGQHLGHYRYEEDLEPTLIYYKSGLCGKADKE